tara:strand:- start:224 stop:472 length:249 start_codon:yes stop_codon:yes gene_type:complete
MPEVKDAVDHLAAKQYDQFSSTVSDLLMDRLKGRIDNEKYSVGQSIFADESEEEELESEDQIDVEPEIDELEQPEETSDEEV